MELHENPNPSHKKSGLELRMTDDQGYERTEKKIYILIIKAKNKANNITEY